MADEHQLRNEWRYITSENDPNASRHYVVHFEEILQSFEGAARIGVGTGTLHP